MAKDKNALPTQEEFEAWILALAIYHKGRVARPAGRLPGISGREAFERMVRRARLAARNRDWCDRAIAKAEKDLEIPKAQAPKRKVLRDGKVALNVRIRPGLRALVRQYAKEVEEGVESLVTRAIRKELLAIRNYMRLSRKMGRG